MSTPDVLVTVERGVPDASVRRSGITVEVRDYDIHAVDPELIWTDEEGRRCVRMVFGRDPTLQPDPVWSDSLKRFAIDLGAQAQIPAAFHPDPSPTGLHVLHINGVDFFFHTDGNGYDGWGRAIHRNRP